MQDMDKQMENIRNNLMGWLSPIGCILLFLGKTAPIQWVFCDGSALSREQYPHLFDVLGTRFGEGDGATTFNLPNLASPIDQARYIIRIGKSVE